MSNPIISTLVFICNIPAKSDIFITNKPQPRPSTAPAGPPRPLPGFEAIVVNGIKAPRVKPEAAEIARKSRGSMSSLLAQEQPRRQVQIGERPRTAPQQPINGPIGQPPITEAPGVPRVKPEASKTAQLGQTGLVGRLFANSGSGLKGDGRLAFPSYLILLFPFKKLHILEVLESMPDF